VTAAKLNYNGMKRAFDDAVYYETKRALPNLPELKPPLAFAFEWHEPNRHRDKDNVRGGAKFILDGFVKAGLLPNDTPAHVSGFAGDWYVYPDEPNYRGEGVLVDIGHGGPGWFTFLGRIWIGVRLPGTNEQGAAREYGARKSVYRRNKARGRR
jgi:hypothetical protein